jgi:hypothetical protein
MKQQHAYGKINKQANDVVERSYKGSDGQCRVNAISVQYQGENGAKSGGKHNNRKKGQTYHNS